MRGIEGKDSKEEESAWLWPPALAKSTEFENRLKLDEDRLAMERDETAHRERAEIKLTEVDETRLQLDRQPLEIDRMDRCGQF